MSWLEIACELPSHLAEPCSDALENQGALSTSFFDGGDQPLLEPAPNTTPLWDKVKVVGLFPAETDIVAIQNTLIAEFPNLSFSVTTLPEQDWTRTWLEHFKPMQFGKKVWIVPSDTVMIKLDPGLAFGTGTHPTTALCLEWLDANPPHDQTVIDYGCGSGILAIAALKLGAQKAYAVDYDPQALTATLDNAARNDIAENKLFTLKPEALPPIQAQTILANILAEPLISLAPTLTQCCAPGGYLVMSGLLSNQADKVKAAYSDFFDFDQIIIKEDWVLLAGRRSESV